MPPRPRSPAPQGAAARPRQQREDDEDEKPSCLCSALASIWGWYSWWPVQLLLSPVLYALMLYGDKGSNVDVGAALFMLINSLVFFLINPCKFLLSPWNVIIYIAIPYGFCVWEQVPYVPTPVQIFAFGQAAIALIPKGGGNATATPPAPNPA